MFEDLYSPYYCLFIFGAFILIGYLYIQHLVTHLCVVERAPSADVRWLFDNARVTQNCLMRLRKQKIELSALEKRTLERYLDLHHEIYALTLSLQYQKKDIT